MTIPSIAAAPTLADAYRRNRARSRALFDLLSEEAYYSRPIDLRHPVVFYEGHLPAFSFNTLVKRALGGPVIDADLERLFARGIDPPSPESGYGGTSPPSPESGYGVTSPSESPSSSVRVAEEWPDRTVVQAFADEADRRVLDALMNSDLDRPGHALLDRAEAAHAILEHEAMHQETLLYMWHRLPHHQKRRPSAYVPRTAGAPPSAEWIGVPSGIATLGVDRASLAFGWDNEFPAHRVAVDAFAIEEHDVTNARFLEFVEAGGTPPAFWERRDGEWYWRGMFEWIPLPLAWPVYVSHAAACAFARWRGARLPTEAEFQRAAFGTPDDDERRYPWGDAEPGPHHGVFDFSSWDPEPTGSRPRGRSAFGVHDLVGNGWEWTSTPFAPFPGFRPMASYPEYSADFFDGGHYVMKGASPATARELLRPSFRNWFRPHYPYVYATFRLAKDVA